MIAKLLNMTRCCRFLPPVIYQAILEHLVSSTAAFERLLCSLDSFRNIALHLDPLHPLESRSKIVTGLHQKCNQSFAIRKPISFPADTRASAPARCIILCFYVFDVDLCLLHHPEGQHLRSTGRSDKKSSTTCFIATISPVSNERSLEHWQRFSCHPNFTLPSSLQNLFHEAQADRCSTVCVSREF